MRSTEIVGKRKTPARAERRLKRRTSEALILPVVGALVISSVATMCGHEMFWSVVSISQSLSPPQMPHASTTLPESFFPSQPMHRLLPPHTPHVSTTLPEFGIRSQPRHIVSAPSHCLQASNTPSHGWPDIRMTPSATKGPKSEYPPVDAADSIVDATDSLVAMRGVKQPPTEAGREHTLARTVTLRGDCASSLLTSENRKVMLCPAVIVPSFLRMWRASCPSVTFSVPGPCFSQCALVCTDEPSSYSTWIGRIEVEGVLVPFSPSRCTAVPAMGAKLNTKCTSTEVFRPTSRVASRTVARTI
mmetsp:Transcript_4640/g.7553  ORF Transcript_4640/g.7553 Transcript_4640/m.7553 type:complete len:303 (-) Transcript_4640:2805-3713(-)